MLKELYERVLKSARPETVVVDGRVFSTDHLHPIAAQAPVKAIEIHSLTGVVDYVKSKFDKDDKFLIHIKSANELDLIDALDPTNNRRVYLNSQAILPNIKFENFIDRERFQIMLQANFVSTEHREIVLDIISHINIVDNGVELKDNGLTQTVTVKSGAATLSPVTLPPRVVLKPFRSFVEVPQPASEYIFRLDGQGRPGLFEADGGSWQLEAIENIAEYFKNSLSEEIEAGKIYVLR